MIPPQSITPLSTTSTPTPTVKEASKKHKEWSMILSDYLARPVAAVLVKTPISPNQVSLLSFIIGLAGAYFLWLGGHTNLVIGAVLAFGYNVLDMVDGIIARVKSQRSVLGHWLDGVLGFILFPILILGLAAGMKSTAMLLLGMLAIVSFPLQFTLVYFYKFEVAGTKEALEIPGPKWMEWTRYAYGLSFFYVFLLVAAIFNRPGYVLWFWATLGNLYWAGIVVTQYLAIRKKAAAEKQSYQS